MYLFELMSGSILMGGSSGEVRGRTKIVRRPREVGPPKRFKGSKSALLPFQENASVIDELNAARIQAECCRTGIHAIAEGHDRR
jgi:hypothetical protein